MRSESRWRGWRRWPERLVARRWLVGLIPLVAGAFAVSVAGEASGVAARSSATSCKSPTSQPPNRRGGDNRLSGVAVTSGCRAWAVGSYDPRESGHDRTLILYWNGKHWKIQPSPNPGRSSRGPDFLNGVAATSRTNAWAVGYHGDYYRTQRTIIEHWNGTAWKVQASPSPRGAELSGVAATSARNAWAVGNYLNPHHNVRALIEHWNGKTWKIEKSPNVGISSLSAVTAISTTNAWAVGYYKSDGNKWERTLALHRNGTAWSP